MPDSPGTVSDRQSHRLLGPEQVPRPPAGRRGGRGRRVVAPERVPLDAIPDLSDTQVIIYSRWDRSPDVVEAQVTYPIVTAMLGAPKVRAVRGFSDFGYSFVYVIFEDGTDIYWARTRTLEYLSGVLGRLPPDAKTELGPDATGLGWVFQYALVDKSGQRSLADLRSYQDWTLRYYLKSVPGVAEVASLGGFGRQYQVNVDPNKLRNYGLSIQRVVEAVRGGNIEAGGRLIEFGGTEYMVRGRGYAQSIADFESIVVSASESGTPIRVRDIGQVVARAGPAARRVGSRRHRRGRLGHHRHAPGPERPRRHRPRQEAHQGDRARPAARGVHRPHLRPLRPHPAGHRQRHGDARRGHPDRRLHRPAVPVARAERAHPGHHHPGRRARRRSSRSGCSASPRTSCRSAASPSRWASSWTRRSSSSSRRTRSWRSAAAPAGRSITRR